MISPRRVFYLHLGALFPSVLIGQHELWGYGHVLQSGIAGHLLDPVASLLFLSSLGFPVAVAVALLLESGAAGERWAWVIFPLSVIISFIQFVAMSPLIS